MNIRPMLEEDADAVRRVDTLAFTPLFEKTGAARSATGEFPLRTRENILAARAIFPQGCFVADPGQHEVAGSDLDGYIFARTWGTVGWVGVFGVHPQSQGQRVGQQLLERSIEALRSAGCTTIGLETIPDSYYNIGLYARQGFRPITMTFSLQKAVAAGAASSAIPPLNEAGAASSAIPPLNEAGAASSAIPPLNEAGAASSAIPPLNEAGAAGEGCRVLTLDDAAGLAEVSRISQAAWPGLDLRAEAVNAMQYAWAQPVLIGSGAVHTVAIARVVSRRENQPNTLYEVTALAGLPEARRRLPELARSLEGFAAQQGFTHLRLILNSADWPSMQVLLDQGYRVVHSALRLMLLGDYGGHPGLEFSRWAM